MDRIPGLEAFSNVCDQDSRAYPRIIQMQGTTYKSHPDDRARMKKVKEILEKVRMGELLLDIVAEFAKKENFPAVAIVPAVANPNVEHEDFFVSLAGRIYDATARRRHIRHQHGNGLYVQEL